MPDTVVSTFQVVNYLILTAIYKVGSVDSPFIHEETETRRGEFTCLKPRSSYPDRPECIVNHGPRILNLRTTDTWGWRIPCCRGLYSIWQHPRLYPPDASSSIPAPLPVVATKTVSRHCQPSPARQNRPQLSTAAPCRTAPAPRTRPAYSRGPGTAGSIRP